MTRYTRQSAIPTASATLRAVLGLSSSSAGQFDSDSRMAPTLEMQATIDRLLTVIMSAAVAVMAAGTVGYIAHYDFGFSREEIRTPAFVGAVGIGALLAVEHFGKKLQKFK